MKASAKKYAVPVAIVQSVIFRGILRYGADDPAGDLLARMSGKYSASIDLAQMKPDTAIHAKKAVLDSLSHPLSSMYTALQDDQTNIDYAAMMLMMEAIQ